MWFIFPMQTADQLRHSTLYEASLAIQCKLMYHDLHSNIKHDLNIKIKTWFILINYIWISQILLLINLYLTGKKSEWIFFFSSFQVLKIREKISWNLIFSNEFLHKFNI